MVDLTAAYLIWDRACGDDPVRDLPGDRALADMLRAHGLAMNGGVLHMVECLSGEEFSKAEAGYRYYGLNEAVSLLSRAKQLIETEKDLGQYEQQLDMQYVAAASESMLTKKFESDLRSNPPAYAALRSVDKM